MKIKDIMTPHCRCIAADASVVAAADLMKEMDVGFLPVCENDRLVGAITDRDIALRSVAEAREAAGTPVRAIMSPKIVYIFEDQDAEEAARIMEVRQIRRLPVLNREKRLVGVVSLGDLAINTGIQLSGEALQEISQHAHPVSHR